MKDLIIKFFKKAIFLREKVASFGLFHKGSLVLFPLNFFGFFFSANFVFAQNLSLETVDGNPSKMMEVRFNDSSGFIYFNTSKYVISLFEPVMNGAKEGHFCSTWVNNWDDSLMVKRFVETCS